MLESSLKQFTLEPVGDDMAGATRNGNRNGQWTVSVFRLMFLSLLGLQVVEDGYEFFAKRQLVTLFSAPNYCGEFDNAGAMMSVDETLMCSFQVNEQLHLLLQVATETVFDVHCSLVTITYGLLCKQ